MNGCQVIQTITISEYLLQGDPYLALCPTSASEKKKTYPLLYSADEQAKTVRGYHDEFDVYLVTHIHVIEPYQLKLVKNQYSFERLKKN